MAVGEVYGLDRFSRYMEGLEDCYAITGGTACDIILSGLTSTSGRRRT